MRRKIRDCSTHLQDNNRMMLESLQDKKMNKVTKKVKKLRSVIF